MLVSVYIPTRNRLPLLKRAIRSVLSQSYENLELVVFDDCSNDGTSDFLRDQQTKGRLIAICSDTQVGPCMARNIAIHNCQGECITGLDDDDYFSHDDKIGRFVSTWNSLSDSGSGLFDSVLLQAVNGESIRCTAPTVSHRDLLKSNAVGSYVFAPKTHFLDAGLFDPNMPAWQDWDLWIRMSKRYGSFKNILLCGTVVDERHDSARISTKSQEVIRKAMLNMTKKLSPLTIRESSYLISALHAYPQVRPTLKETLTVIAALRLKASVNSTKKLLAGLLA